MTRIKKSTALFIILALMASMFTFAAPVSAESATLPAVTVTDEDVALSVKLETLGVITNEFDLSGYVTRGEMASIAATYISIPESSTQCFSDVTPDNKYYGAIGALYNMGVITGDDQGKFNPDNYVTYDEALVFIINAIGHKPFAVREGGYPTGYHRVAIKHDMLSDLSMQKGTDAVTLADVYKMLDKGLTAATVVTSYYGDGSIRYTLSNTETFLSANYKIRQFRGIVTGNEATKLTSAVSNLKAEQIEIDGTTYDLSGYGNADLLGRSVDFYISTEEPDVIIHIEETAKVNQTVKVDADDILTAKTTATRIYYADENDKEYHIDFKSTIDVIYNGQCTSSYGVLSAILPTTGYVEALDNNRDGEYDVLFIYNYTNVVVGTVDSYNETVTDEYSGTPLNLSSDDQTTAIRFVNQTKKIRFESIKVGDVLSVAKSLGTPAVINVYVSREVVTGKIEGYDSKLGYSINGEWYEAAADYAGTALSLGMSGEFYLDMNAEIADYKPGSTDANAKLAVMAGLDYKLGTFTNRITVKLFTEEEKFIDADLRENVKINGVRYDLTESADATAVLGTIGTISSGNYIVNRAYVVVYTLDSEGLVSSLDLGGIGGPGKLNSMTNADTSLLVRPNYILVYKDDLSADVRSRYNPGNGKIFYAPADGDLGDLDGYGIYKDFKTNHMYQAGVTSYTGVETYAIYSFEEDDIPTADVILFRGMGALGIVAPQSKLGVITDVTTAVDKEEQSTCKIYFGETGYTAKADITFTKNDSTTEVVTTSIASQLVPGTAVQYAINNDGEISAIKVIADYNSTTGALTPAFKDASTFIQDSYDNDQDEKNIIVGTVVENDPKTNQLIFTTNGTDRYLLYTSGTNVSIYRGARKIVTESTISDLLPGDKFVCRTELYYIPKDMVVYR